MRRCLTCGADFDGISGQTLCPACAAASRAASVVRNRTCRGCGAVFPGGPRAWYCPSCRVRRMREASARFRANGRVSDRPMGSIDHCVICGAEYVVKSARQKYCPSCAPAAVRAVDRVASSEWARINIDMAQRTAERRAAAAEISCVICGKTFTPHSAARTCSPDCSAELARRNNAEYERTHREQRNAYRRDRYAAQKARKTPPPN